MSQLTEPSSRLQPQLFLNQPSFDQTAEGGNAMDSFRVLFLISCLTSISQAQRSSPVKAASLGGWLVTEGWVKPSLFDEIPVNKDLLDGTKIQLKSATQNKYLTAEKGGGSAVVADRSAASGWDTFRLWRIKETMFQFRVYNWQFFELDEKGKLVATSTYSNDSDSSKTFELFRKEDDTNRIRIRAPNGSFLEVKPDASVAADHLEDTDWGDDDPSVFMLTVVGQLQGEFQVTNGYGPHKAASVMTKHWKSFIVENDFKFMSENGLTAVKIPVGWWIRYSQNPPPPFVAGSLKYLDNAFFWAEKYNLKVIISLHAAPGSQNVWDHSGTRDGSQSWGRTVDTINQTLLVIDFLALRYASRPGLYAIELMNEPLAPGVKLDILKKFYQAGYNTVRKYSSAYVIMSNRLSIRDPKELLQFASGFSGAVVDVHYYNYFSGMFKSMSVQQNIDYVNKFRAAELSSLMVSNGPLIFVGEWSAEMYAENASYNDYQRFGSAQIDVYGRATFGWAYWTLKNDNIHWSLEWLIRNGYITL